MIRKPLNHKPPSRRGLSHRPLGHRPLSHRPLGHRPLNRTVLSHVPLSGHSLEEDGWVPRGWSPELTVLLGLAALGLMLDCLAWVWLL